MSLVFPEKNVEQAFVVSPRAFYPHGVATRIQIRHRRASDQHGLLQPDGSTSGGEDSKLVITSNGGIFAACSPAPQAVEPHVSFFNESLSTGEPAKVAFAFDALGLANGVERPVDVNGCDSQMPRNMATSITNLEHDLHRIFTMTMISFIKHLYCALAFLRSPAMSILLGRSIGKLNILDHINCASAPKALLTPNMTV